MEGVAHDGELDALVLQDLHQRPEIRVQDGIAPCDVEVGLASERLAEVLDVGERLLHLPEAHAVELDGFVPREDVAVLAALVAVVEEVPLKREGRACHVLAPFEVGARFCGSPLRFCFWRLP